VALLGDFEGVGRERDDVVVAVDPERAFECLFEGRHNVVPSCGLGSRLQWNSADGVIMAVVHLFLSLLGAVLPYAKFVPWVREHGLNLPLLLTELFSTRIGGFFGLDVILSAVTLLIFIRSEGGHRKMRLLWLPVAATCLVGVSCGLPLFLYLRERQGGMTRQD
jgi:Terpene cyclase DEP1